MYPVLRPLLRRNSPAFAWASRAPYFLMTEAAAPRATAALSDVLCP
jgi:hypothetical protein